jgi:hypothetical protein
MLSTRLFGAYFGSNSCVLATYSYCKACVLQIALDEQRLVGSSCSYVPAVLLLSLMMFTDKAGLNS